IPDGYSAEQAAPLLCAGLIGYRAYRMALTTLPQENGVLGLYGFGAAAHLLIQVARHDGHRVFAYTRAGDNDAQQFALKLGAEWAGDATQATPDQLDAAIIFAPAGELVPAALRALRKGRSEEHTSELQSRENLVCRLLLEKKKKKTKQQQR